jgi:general secretion pathway protein B
MSYILDALKKSELQRAQQSNSSASVAPDAPVTLDDQTESASAITVIALLLAVLVLLAVLLFRLLPLQGTEPEAAVAQTVVSATDKPSTRRDQAKQTAPTERPLKEHVAEFVPPPVTVTEPAAQIKPVDAPAVTAAENKTSPEAAAKAPAAAARRVDNARSLPPLDALRRIPPLMITSHIYSPVAEKRTVSMNNREWNEGDLVAPGVVLSEITPTGILLDVDGWPLHIGRSKGWQAIP